MAGKEIPVEATTIVQSFVLLLAIEPIRSRYFRPISQSEARKKEPIRKEDIKRNNQSTVFCTRKKNH
jgi:hypothetical protein